MRIVIRMTGRAILRRALEDIVHMAGLTSHRTMFSIQMESELGMIDCRRFPAIGRVTSRALSSQLTSVGIIVHMARDAILRCAFELTVDMTAGTSNGVVRPV